jgi:hypothetical protein
MTVLQLPSPLVGDYIASPGDYTPGSVVDVLPRADGTPIRVDLTKAKIHGSGTGFLFRPRPGANLIVELGANDNLAGYVLGVLDQSGEANVELIGGVATDVKQLVNCKAAGVMRLNAVLTEVEGHNLGTGIRTYGSAVATKSKLYGGNKPTYGDPTGVRGLDLNDSGIVDPTQVVILDDCDVYNFNYPDTNPDNSGAEESCAVYAVTHCRMGGAGDASCDSKADYALLFDNVFYGAGVRIAASHIGRMVSMKNTYYVGSSMIALQTSSGYGNDPNNPTEPGLLSLDDSFVVQDATSVVMKALVQLTGSTGNTGPRTGFGQLIGAKIPAGYDLASLCKVVPTTKDGVTYSPHIQLSQH